MNDLQLAAQYLFDYANALEASGHVASAWQLRSVEKRIIEPPSNVIPFPKMDS
jgi:hypothetical protein